MIKRILAAGIGVAALTVSSVVVTTPAFASSLHRHKNVAAKHHKHKGKHAASKSPYIVGVSWDSTTASAAYTDVTQRTLNLAIKLLNKSGGVNGHPIKFVFANDESTPTKTPATIAQLANEGAKFILFNTGTDYAGKAELVKLGIPGMGVTDVVPNLTQAPNNQYSWLDASLITNWATVYCGAFKKLHYKTLGILRTNSATTEGLDRGLFPPLEKCVHVVDIETAPGTSKTLTSYVARLKAKSPSAILVADLGGPFEILAQSQIHQAMPTVPRWSLATIVNEPKTWKLAAKGVLNGIISMGSLNPKNKQTQKLEKILKKHYGASYHMSVFDANAWDTVQLMKDAMVRAGSDTPKKVNAAMAKNHSYLAHFGQPGYHLTYSKTKHSGANGLCGLVLEQFTANNTPSKAFAGYQPQCAGSGKHHHTT